MLDFSRPASRLTVRKKRMADKSTSTSDPVTEDDHIQVPFLPFFFFELTCINLFHVTAHHLMYLLICTLYSHFILQLLFLNVGLLKTKLTIVFGC